MACHESTTIPWQVNLIRGIFIGVCACEWDRVCLCSLTGWRGMRTRKRDAEEFSFWQMFTISVVQAYHNAALWAMPGWSDGVLGGHTHGRGCAQMSGSSLCWFSAQSTGFDVRANTLTPGLAWFRVVMQCLWVQVWRRVQLQSSLLRPLVLWANVWAWPPSWSPSLRMSSRVLLYEVAYVNFHLFHLSSPPNLFLNKFDFFDSDFCKARALLHCRRLPLLSWQCFKLVGCRWCVHF